MPGRFKIQIIDVTQQPHLARQNNLIALPMAVRTLPAPIRKIVGDFRNEVGSTIQVEMTATDKKGAIRKNINKASKHV